MFFCAFRSSRVGISSQKGRKMIVFEPKRINQWQLSRFVPSGIIYGRMGRTMRNYGLRIISSPENKHSFYVEEENLSPDLQITDDEHVDLREDLCHECRRITRESGYKINGMTIDELVHYLKLKLQGGGDFRSDFCKFWREQAETMKPGTRGIYISALNAFQRFIHAESYNNHANNLTYGQ